MELELSIETKDTGAISVEHLPLSGRLVLGRGPESPVALDGPLISREHVGFEFLDGSLTVEDLSANGSWLNGQTLARGRKYKVTEADRVQLPGYEFRCLILNAAQAPAPAKPDSAAPPPPPVKSAWAGISGMEIVVLITLLAVAGLAVIFFRA